MASGANRRHPIFPLSVSPPLGDPRFSRRWALGWPTSNLLVRGANRPHGEAVVAVCNHRRYAELKTITERG
jgi:hypothetical protein